MTINGIGPLLPDPLGLRREPSPASDRAGNDGPSVRSRGAEAAPLPPGDGRGVDRVDSEIWSLLSGEEIAWYMRSGLSGPATYGPVSDTMTGNGSTARLGQRLDLRV
jgi:hypothetical protein